MPKYKQIENSLYTDSKGYDPLKAPDILRVEVATGRLLADNRDKYYGRYRLACDEPGTVEFLRIEEARKDGRAA